MWCRKFCGAGEGSYLHTGLGVTTRHVLLYPRRCGPPSQVSSVFWCRGCLYSVLLSRLSIPLSTLLSFMPCSRIVEGECVTVILCNISEWDYRIALNFCRSLISTVHKNISMKIFDTRCAECIAANSRNYFNEMFKNRYSWKFGPLKI